MNDISDGELKFTDCKQLEAWLKRQPRNVGALREAIRAFASFIVK